MEENALEKTIILAATALLVCAQAPNVEAASCDAKVRSQCRSNPSRSDCKSAVTCNTEGTNSRDSKCDEK